MNEASLSLELNLTHADVFRTFRTRKMGNQVQARKRSSKGTHIRYYGTGGMCKKLQM